MISSCDMALKSVMEREIAHINMVMEGHVQTEYSIETLVTVLQYLESRIKTLS
jgi:hypothetical protein